MIPKIKETYNIFSHDWEIKMKNKQKSNHKYITSFLKKLHFILLFLLLLFY